jgi:hypothetical protein
LQPGKVHVDDLDVELRVVSKSRTPLGDLMAEGGGWKGESPCFGLKMRGH